MESETVSVTWNAHSFLKKPYKRVLKGNQRLSQSPGTHIPPSKSLEKGFERESEIDSGMFGGMPPTDSFIGIAISSLKRFPKQDPFYVVFLLTCLVILQYHCGSPFPTYSPANTFEENFCQQMKSFPTTNNTFFVNAGTFAYRRSKM